MKSSLKKIYNARDRFDILNTPDFRMITNPIYQVNKFISSKDSSLTKNFVNNLQDLTIYTERNSAFKNDYDYVTNTIYCNDNMADVFGLLHVASNDRNKEYTGIILPNAVGYGLNNGLTEMFTHDINYINFSYIIEATVAKALWIIDSDLLTHSYFTNSGENLMALSDNIKDLMQLLDNYHDNYIKLMDLYKLEFRNKFDKFRLQRASRELEVIYRKTGFLESQNYSYIKQIFILLSGIIDNSMLNEEQKQDLYIRLDNEFKLIFDHEVFSYLLNLNQEFEKKIYVKKK